MSQAAACNGRHSLAERCARWLLAAGCWPRTTGPDGDELRLTQEFLALMPGVRRAGATAAVQALEAAGLVQGRRGRILVCDRPGLEGAACGCYGRVRDFEAMVAEGYDAAEADAPEAVGGLLAAAAPTHRWPGAHLSA